MLYRFQTPSAVSASQDIAYNTSPYHSGGSGKPYNGLLRKQLLESYSSSPNLVLIASDLDEGTNASDPEIIEINGSTYIYYAVGDQRTWMNVKRARFPGTLTQFLESWYRQPGIPDIGTLGINTGK